MKLLKSKFVRCGLSLVVAFAVTTTAISQERASKSTIPLRVVGYLPDYRLAEFDVSKLRGVTDLNVFSAYPTAEGGLELKDLKASPAWTKLKAWKTRERVRLVLCVGGWDRSKHFAEIALTDSKRAEFAKAAVRTCLEERFDGLDLDWEHPQNESEQEGYAKLLTSLRTAFQPHGLVLSVTIAGWQTLSRDAFAAVDSVNLMAYDNDGQHSTFEAAQRDLKRLRDLGVPAEKLVLGLPFYGRHLTNKEQALTYGQIVAQHKLPPNSDEVAGVYFNGPRTIQRKVKLALDQKLNGIMIWELGQDAHGDKSLLKVVTDTIGSSPR